jgi:TRAP-type C4-dicarboxylate transport system permease small subunit
MVTFFGCHVAVCENRLAAVTILLEKLTGISKKAVNFLANLSIIFLLAMVAYYGYYLCQQPAITKSVTSVLQWPLVIFYYMLPLSSAFMLYHMLIQCAMDLLGIECTPLGQQTEGTVD